MDANIARIKELIEILNKAGKSYYSEGTEIMSNFEYDNMYDELVRLEEMTGYVQSNSPTVNVGYEVLSELPKEKHESAMLSLDKTKDPEALAAWLKDKEGLLSWKLDGLTVVVTYENGTLAKAVTRGNGEIGEVITNNAKVFKNLPVTIPFKGQLIIRGEAVITYSDFKRINDMIPEEGAKYKNPRNLCSGSVRQLNNRVTQERNVRLYAFSLVKAGEIADAGANADTSGNAGENSGENATAAAIVAINSRHEQMEWLRKQGFETVEYKMVNRDNIMDTIQWFQKQIETNDFPSDGLVITYDDIAYGESLGRTAKFPRNSMAFKWSDETMETTLLEIEWSASRTGLINPIAVFEPVDLEGTQVSRASVHNISIMEDLELGVGDTIVVYKANMIIPQIADNLTRSGVRDIPKECPVCNGATQISQQNQVKSLYCTNPYCPAKHSKSLEHFVARDAMNIDGLSTATLDKLIEKNLVKKFRDIYHLGEHKDEIVAKDKSQEPPIPGFGLKSYDNLIKSIEQSRHTTLAKVIYSLGIDNIGLSNAKMVCKKLGNDPERILSVTRDEMMQIEGIGSVIAESFVSYFEDENNRAEFEELLKELEFEDDAAAAGQGGNALEGLTFVITGSVEHFENRNQLKDYIESLGGKTTGSVTGNTDYLINNDSMSASSKNKNAAKLGVPVITEEEFLKLAQK